MQELRKYRAISTRSLPFTGKATGREFTAVHAVIPACQGASRGQITNYAAVQ